MRALVTGASGFVGAALIGPLRQAGHEVRAFGRSMPRIERAGVVADEVLLGDATSGRGLAAALDEIDVAYYLMHAMEPGLDSFADRELRAATHFRTAARRSGLRRIVYLGTLIPRSANSAHFASRHRVALTLADAAPEVVTLRAPIAIGARSRSFRILVRLIERMPVLALPPWRNQITQPIDERDLVSYLVAAGVSATVDGAIDLDIGGPEAVSYRALIERIRDLMLLRRPPIMLPVGSTPIIGAIVATIVGERPELVTPLMSGLDYGLLPDLDTARQRFDLRLHSLEAAIEHALGVIEQTEPLAAR